MNAPFHDDAMLDDAMLVDALTAIEYMNGIAKDGAPVDIGAITSSGGDDLKHESHHAFNVDTNAIPSALDDKMKMPQAVRQVDAAPVEVTSNCPTATSTALVPGDPPVASRSVTSPAITQPMQLDASSSSSLVVETKQVPDPSSSPYKHIVVTKESGLLGFGVLPVRGVCGIQVSTLQPDSSAAKAGLRVGDVLLKLDNTDVASMAMPAIIQILQAVQPGIPLHISLFRPSVAVPMTAPIGMSKPFASSLVQRSSASSLDASSAPAAKKAKTAPSGGSSSGPSATATIYAETVALKKQLEALTKDLDAATAEKAKLSEKNGMLRKRVQQMVISGDEDKVKLRAEYDQRLAVLVQEKAQLQTTLATVKAQARLDSRAVFDTDVTMEMKTQLDALQRQVAQFEDVDKKRKETRKTHAQIELKLADKYKRQLLKAIVDKVATGLKAISHLRAQSSLRTNAFGAAGSAATAPAQVKVQLELVRRVGVHRLFSVHMATDPLGFPALSPVQLTLPESRIAEVFGKQLSFEERPGLNLVAAAPMEVQYDPTTETLQIVSKWTEQNVIREIARNIRM